MAFEGLAQLFTHRRPWIGPVEFDCSIQEDHGVEVELTDNPIEALPGFSASVSDHAIVKPRAITMVVLVSTSPDRLLPVPQPTRHIKVWRRLRDLALRTELVDVVTTLELYTSMVILSVGYPRRRETTNCAEITCRLRKLEFSIVDTSQAVAEIAADIALAEAELGAQSATAKSAADLAQLGVL